MKEVRSARLGTHLFQRGDQPNLPVDNRIDDSRQIGEAGGGTREFFAIGSAFDSRADARWLVGLHIRQRGILRTFLRIIAGVSRSTSSSCPIMSKRRGLIQYLIASSAAIPPRMSAMGGRNPIASWCRWLVSSAV